MTECIETSHSLLYRELDETIEQLAPAVEALLQRISPDGFVASEPDELEHRVSVRLPFPDGIGRGEVVARLFRYRDNVRVDLEIDHNRVFAGRNGYPSEQRCFLNDFVASVTLPAGTDLLPADFERSVVSGVHASREAVQKHNRNHKQPWNQLKVVEA